ncbi:hypothetical protein ACJZ2D_004382 [Fusarium nematophilum]
MGPRLTGPFANVVSRLCLLVTWFLDQHPHHASTVSSLSDPCPLLPLASALSLLAASKDGIQISFPPYGPLALPTNDPGASEILGNPRLPNPSSSHPDEEHTGLLDQPAADISANLPPCDTDPGHKQAAFSECREQLAASSSAPFGSHQAASHESSTSGDFPAFFLEPNFSSTSVQGQWPIAGTASGSSEISFYCYPFLKIPNLHQLPQQDAAYLESQGCFKIPMRPFLDEIVQHYFLHIHPFLPLINEGDFWESYCHDPRNPPKEPISVLLLQAMLFAACTFISEPTIQGLGYGDIRSMRATFLQRAKSLYHLECESSPVAIAQACVLLSFTSLSSSRKPNTL